MAKIHMRRTPLYDEEKRAPVVRRHETEVAGGVVVEEWTKTGYSRSFLRAAKKAKKK